MSRGGASLAVVLVANTAVSIFHSFSIFIKEPGLWEYSGVCFSTLRLYFGELYPAELGGGRGIYVLWFFKLFHLGVSRTNEV